MNHKKPLVVSAMVVTLCMAIVVSFVYAAQIETLTVDAGTEKVFTVNLNEGDKFSGSISVSGGSGNDINFWITDPNGNTIVNSGRVSQGTSFDFTAQKNGAHSLHFNNGFSLFSSKFVTLSYDIERAILSNPSDLLWIIVAVTLILIGIGAIGIYLSVRRKNRANTSTT